MQVILWKFFFHCHVDHPSVWGRVSIRTSGWISINIWGVTSVFIGILQNAVTQWLHPLVRAGKRHLADDGIIVHTNTVANTVWMTASLCRLRSPCQQWRRCTRRLTMSSWQRRRRHTDVATRCDDVLSTARRRHTDVTTKCDDVVHVAEQCGRHRRCRQGASSAQIGIGRSMWRKLLTQPWYTFDWIVWPLEFCPKMITDSFMFSVNSSYMLSLAQYMYL